MIQAVNNIDSNQPVKRRQAVNRRYDRSRVYDNIINLNKSMPFYKIHLTKENRDFSIGIKDAAFALKEKIKEMTDPDFYDFQSKTVEVSNEEILSAYPLEEDLSGLPENIEIRIKQLSSVQINKSRDLLSTSRSLAPGVYEFKAKAGSKEYNLIFYQESRRDNVTVLKEMADLLNSSIPGINAVVENGRARDYYKLSITADLLAEGGGRLVFEDVDNLRFGVVDFLDMNRMEKAPALSEFEINGLSRQTAGNCFKLDNKLYIMLKATTEEPVYIRIVPDGSRIKGAVEDFLSSYNSMISIVNRHLEANSSNYSAYKLLRELKAIGQTYTDELLTCGITVCEDGSLQMDENLAELAARTGRMEGLFAKSNGFIARLKHKAEAVAVNPMEYIDKTLVTYINAKKSNSRYPYVTSMYSGLFYNALC